MYDAIDKRDVFVCHSSKDSHAAADMVSQLEAAGVSCWIAPRDVEPGQAFADTLYHAIKHAPVFVVLMSSAANSSRDVVRELALADQMQKRIVPVRLEEFDATGAFCYYMRAAHDYQWQEDPQEVLSRISEQVTRAKQ